MKSMKRVGSGFGLGATMAIKHLGDRQEQELQEVTILSGAISFTGRQLEECPLLCITCDAEARKTAVNNFNVAIISTETSVTVTTT